jgi:hypothetical protein
MTTERNLRVGDADRESVAAQLREHYAQGRLTLDELNERLDRAFASRTRTDLNAVTSDLPYTAPSHLLPSDRASQGGGAGQGRSYRDWSSQGPGSDFGRSRARGGLLAVIPLVLALWVCFALVSIFAFGVGPAPSLVAVFLAALAAVRWIFGRGRGRGRRGPNRTARRRRW